MNTSLKFASLSLVVALAACGGGGGDPITTQTPGLAPGIWKKTDNDTAATRFIGVVTTSEGGGDVWGWTFNKAAGTLQMFTGSVSASGEDFVTSQGTLLSYQAGWQAPATGKSLSLPKLTAAGQRVFNFGAGVAYTTELNRLWENTAELGSVNDWSASWTSTEDLDGVADINVEYRWTVASDGTITGKKIIPGQGECDIQSGSKVTPREKAVVNVKVIYGCRGVNTEYSGISFPLVANTAGVVSERAVWMKQTGTEKFVVQTFSRN